MFYDRSGMLSRRVQELVPGLQYKHSSFDQRDFVLPAEDLELFFGVAFAHIQSMVPEAGGFGPLAANFLNAVTETLEVNQLREFRFRYVLGKPCASREEAQNLMLPIVPEETKAKLQSVAQPKYWQALQAEFLVGNFLCHSRIAILEIPPHRKLLGEKGDPTAVVPHITFQLEFRGLAPITVSEFDAKAFIENARDTHTKEVLSKLAPHLA